MSTTSRRSDGDMPHTITVTLPVEVVWRAQAALSNYCDYGDASDATGCLREIIAAADPAGEHGARRWRILVTTTAPFTGSDLEQILDDETVPSQLAATLRMDRAARGVSAVVDAQPYGVAWLAANELAGAVAAQVSAPAEIAEIKPD